MSEVIAAVLGTGTPSTQAVWKNYNALIEKFGDEYTVLLDTPLDELAKVVNVSMAQAILKVRNGNAKVTPGYDGVYGQLVLSVDPPSAKLAAHPPRVQQTNMMDFW